MRNTPVGDRVIGDDVFRDVQTSENSNRSVTVAQENLQNQEFSRSMYMRCLLYSFSFPVHEISAKTCSSSNGHLGLQERVSTSLVKTLIVETCLQPALHLHSG